jgi:nucleoside phosphorylase
MRILLFAALPRELKPLVRSFDHSVALRGTPYRAFACRDGLHDITAVETGVGVERAKMVFSHAWGVTGHEAVISTGYCGALRRGDRVGDLIWATSVALLSDGTVEARTLAHAQALAPKLSAGIPVRAASVLTMAEWMPKAEVTRQAGRLGEGSVCDMETFPLARLSRERGVPFFSLRAVSDGPGHELPFPPAAVCGASGVYSFRRVLALLVRCPHLLCHAPALARDSKKASQSLVKGIHDLLAIL